MLNNKADEDLFREIQQQSGREKPITLHKYFAIRWDAQQTLLEKLVILRHNIITLLGHKKYTGPKDLTPSNLEALEIMHNVLSPSKAFSKNFQEKKELNSLVIFFILELFESLESSTIPADLEPAAFEGLTVYLNVLQNNMHHYLDCFLVFIPTCIGSYLHPSFRTALLTPQTLTKTKQHIIVLIKRLMLDDGTIVLPKPDPVSCMATNLSDLTATTTAFEVYASTTTAFEAQTLQSVSFYMSHVFKLCCLIKICNLHCKIGLSNHPFLAWLWGESNCYWRFLAINRQRSLRLI